MSQDSLTHALSQDSMRRVERLTRRANLSKGMITNVTSDTVEMSIAEGTRRFYETTGVGPIWEPYILRKPAKEEREGGETDLKSSDAPITDSVDNADSPAGQQDTALHNAKELRFKPVRGSRR